MVLVNNGEGKRMTRAEIQKLMRNYGGITITTDERYTEHGKMTEALLLAYISFPATEVYNSEIYNLYNKWREEGLKVHIATYNAIIPKNERYRY